MQDLTKTEVAILIAVTPIAVIVYPFRWLAWKCKSKYKKGSAPGLFVLLVAVLLATGCATSSVRAVREQGGRPTCWERCQLNVCDGVSWINGVVPFGGGQD